VTSVNTPTEFLPDKPLAELIRRIRSVNELTQESFGQFFQPSVTQPTVARWEKGEQMPDQIHFPKIACFIDLTVEELKQLIEDSSSNVYKLKIEKKIFVPNQKHLKIFHRGVEVWNRWRDKNPEIVPMLAGIELNDLNLDNINLEQADLRGIKFNNVISRQALYCNADLRYAYLNKTCFFQSDFRFANISQATIIDASLGYAICIESDFYKSQLSNVYFNCANLKSANLEKTKLTNVNFTESNCILTSFKNAILSDSNVFGANFIEANLDNLKLENIFISRDEKKTFSVNDLLSTQSIYLQRYNRTKFKTLVHKFQLEEEIIDLASILVDTYGSFNLAKGFKIFKNYEVDNQSSPFIEVRRNESSLQVVFFSVRPNYTEQNIILPKEIKSRKILEINGEIVESNFELEDVDVLRKLVYLYKNLQKERVSNFIPIIQKILELNKNNNYTCEKYIIEKTNEEIILFENLNCKIELMRINFAEKQLKIVRSSLSNECIIYFQQLLLNLIM
jgi:uncharacterized protein YjbI with pentapeptide repeats/DNA-binding XRE family transcriptional regulator